MTRQDKLKWAKSLRATAKRIRSEILRGFSDQTYATAAEQLESARNCACSAEVQADHLEEGRM